MKSTNSLPISLGCRSRPDGGLKGTVAWDSFLAYWVPSFLDRTYLKVFSIWPFGAFSWSSNELNHTPTWFLKGQIKKTSGYVLFKQGGTEKAKKPSHASVPESRPSPYFYGSGPSPHPTQLEQCHSQCCGSGMIFFASGSYFSVGFGSGSGSASGSGYGSCFGLYINFYIIFLT